MKAGDYVMCVDDTNWNEDVYRCFNIIPVAGNVYLIRRIITNWNIPNGKNGIALEGIFGDWDIFETYDGIKVYDEYHFSEDRFQLVKSEQQEYLSERKNLKQPPTNKGLQKKSQPDNEIIQEYLERFQKFSNQELVDAFNQEVKIGTVAVRRQMLYIMSLGQLMQERFATSPMFISDSESLNLMQRIILRDDKIYPVNLESN